MPKQFTEDFNIDNNGTGGRNFMEIEIKEFYIRDNVREHTDDDDIEGLANTIAIQGLIHPITVYPDGDKYFIEDGHRRFAAIQYLKSKNKWSGPVPVIVEKTARDDNMIHGRQAIANIQRKDLTAMELTKSISRLVKEHGSQKAVADLLGRSKEWVSRSVAAEELVSTNPKAAGLTKRSAADISTVPKDQQKPLIDAAINGKMTERQVRAAVAKTKGRAIPKKKGKPADPPGIKVAKQFIRAYSRLTEADKEQARKHIKANLPEA